MGYQSSFLGKPIFIFIFKGPLTLDFIQSEWDIRIPSWEIQYLVCRGTFILDFIQSGWDIRIPSWEIQYLVCRGTFILDLILHQNSINLLFYYLLPKIIIYTFAVQVWHLECIPAVIFGRSKWVIRIYILSKP